MKIVLIVLTLACVAYYFYNSANTKKIAALNHEQGSAFLSENGKKDGVITTASGLQYQVLQSGNGDRHPTATDVVRVHYHGTLINGTVFDSSVERGETISFPLNQVIAGWTEGVQLMKVGDRFRFFIPSGLGYGNRNSSRIPAASVLIFDVELFEIK